MLYVNSSGSQPVVKPKYGPRTVLILGLEMVRRSFCLIDIVNFYYTYLHSGDLKVVLDQEKVGNPWYIV